MKWLLTFLLTIFISELIKAQDSSSCTCYHAILSPRYPKKADDNKISGVVIIEFEVDGFCLYSNPIVKKGLGYGCDEEALKIVRQFIERSNACRKKCPVRSGCSPGKMIQPVSFSHVEE